MYNICMNFAFQLRISTQNTENLLELEPALKELTAALLSRAH